MNPFVWRGPEFLLFYLMLAAAVLIWQAVRKSHRQSAVAAKANLQSNQPKLNVSDPYEVAYLRSGSEGAIRVAVVRLLDEGLLVEFAPGRIRRQSQDVGPGVAHLAPVERAVYDYCRVERRASEIPGAWPVKSELAAQFAAYRTRLDAGGLLVGPTMRSRHLVDWIYCSAGLIAVAGIKILYALANGHRNIWFLVTLAMLSFVVSCIIAYSGRVTAAGTQTIENLRKLAQPAAAMGFHARGGELAMAAALFGFAALPSLAGEQYRKLYGATPGGGDGTFVSTDSSGGSSSSCGASSSSCGGGGGGCGGCGGGGGD